MKRRDLLRTSAAGSLAALPLLGAVPFEVQAPDQSNGYWSVKQFGAVGDGTTDDTAALQKALNATKNLVGNDDGATLYFPPGKYLVTAPLKLRQCSGLRLVGASMQTAQIVTASNDLFSLDGPAHFVTMEHLRLISEAGGGHIWNVTGNGNASNWVLRRLFVEQKNPTKSYWSQLNGDASARDGYIDNKVEECAFFGRSENDHRVPLWNFTAHGNVNSNTWERCRFTYGGNYVFQIDDQSLDGWSYANTFRDLTFEVTAGGVAAFYNCRVVILDNCAVWDVKVTTADLYVFGPSPTTNRGDTRDVDMRNCVRYAGRLGSGLSDVRYDGRVRNDTPNLLFTSCRNIGGSPFGLNLSGKNATLIGCDGIAIASPGPGTSHLMFRGGLQSVR